MGEENKIEELREKLHRHIIKYGRDSPKTLKVSQELDKLIVEETKKQCINKNK
ncbi:aspartyl-phosphate phosphatase Spo0E family protein [uncultured Clostridium sp.]|uniref:aspartyl-phosphate phosphatase Spo0E family protein n=1 Tax=uncultured Clostridium sp. TaxID=59620 RepID=UPI0028E7B740|nr:aspartyl-phosphate phosphatase Spo0E family protein [uncultured Clostridium sp.]